MKTNARDRDDLARFADMLAAMGTETRLRIMRLLLSAYPDGLVVGDIQEALGINASTLSHHLDRLKHEQLVGVSREGTFLRYSADADVLQSLVTFLYGECCTRNKVVNPAAVARACQC